MKNETAPKPEHDDQPLPPSRFAPIPLTSTVAKLDGLYVVGEVIGRRRTSFQQKGDGATRYNISVALIGQCGKLIVERWTDNPAPPDLPRVGDKACIPVTLQHFQTKSGVGTRLCWGATERGEAF